MVIGFSIALIVFSLLLMLLVLMHKGKGGGLSDMFGGGMQSSVGGSSVAERNLDRITIVIASAVVRLHRRARHPDEARATDKASEARPIMRVASSDG